MPTRRTLIVSALIAAASRSPKLSADTSGQDRATPQTVLLFIDDLHIGFASTPKLRTGVRQATERLLASGRSVALVSDGTSSVVIQATTDTTPLSDVARKITGAGLKPSEIANPTPAVAADMARRESTAQTVLQRTIAAMRPDAVIYVTERQPQPTVVATIPVVVTRPEAMEAAAVAPPSR